ncbi:MAG: TfoX/Sxy family protein [Patescibacteria group bacterium]|nr:TfoX/Sxy family protein [Patescibacteria group bacterium]
MARDQGFHDYIVYDLLSELPDLRSRGMFDGHGLYQKDTFFGFVNEGVLYLKTGEADRSEYKEYGSAPFSYPRAGKTATLHTYWAVPGEILDDPPRLLEWAERAIQATLDK